MTPRVNYVGACLIVAALMTLIGISACATFPRPPQEPWVTPATLPLNENALSGLVIKVRCQTANDELSTARNTNRHPLCKDAVDILGRFGAKVDLAESEEDTDKSYPLNLILTQYQTDRDYCGWTLLPAIVGGFILFPCVEDLSNSLSIELRSSDNTVVNREVLHFNYRAYYGAWGLIFLLNRGLRSVVPLDIEDKNRAHLGVRYRQHLVDTVYSYFKQQENRQGQRLNFSELHAPDQRDHNLVDNPIF